MSQYVSGFPEPPFYFREYESLTLQKENQSKNEPIEKRKEEIKEIQQKLHELNKKFHLYDIQGNKKIHKNDSEEIEKFKEANTKFMLGRPPPRPPKENYFVFGMNSYLDRKIDKLDSDDLLYDDTNNLKEEFKKLYKLYKETIFELFDDIINNRKDDKSKMKYLIKIHTNLFHILANLRYYQTIDQIVNVLKVQLKRRQIAIDKMKLSLLHVHNYINFVQTNFAQTKNAILDESNESKQKKLKSTDK